MEFTGQWYMVSTLRPKLYCHVLCHIRATNADLSEDRRTWEASPRLPVQPRTSGMPWQRGIEERMFPTDVLLQAWRWVKFRVSDIESYRYFSAIVILILSSGLLQCAVRYDTRRRPMRARSASYHTREPSMPSY